MPVDAAAGRAAATLLERAYARSVRKMRGYRGLDPVHDLGGKRRRMTVVILVNFMTAALGWYLLAGLALAGLVIVVSTRIHPWIVRYVVTALALVPAAMPLTAMATMLGWQTVVAIRTRRTGWPRLGQDDVAVLLARGGLLAWRLALVVGVVGAIAVSAVPAPVSH